MKELVEPVQQLSVPLRFLDHDNLTRRGEPVTFGLPWPRGAVKSTAEFSLRNGRGQNEKLQCSVLDRWSDGSIRWCLFDVLATTELGHDLTIYTAPIVEPNGDQVHGTIINQVFQTENFIYEFGTSNGLVSARSSRSTKWTEISVQLILSQEGAPDLTIQPRFSYTWSETGPIRWRATFQSDPLPQGLIAFGHFDLFNHLPVAKCQFTLRNTQAAGHPGGNWDLGNSGSVYIRDLAIILRTPEIVESSRTGYSVDVQHPVEYTCDNVELYQDSSGGENWNNHNHLDRNRKIPFRQKGYSLRVGSQIQYGLRATPIVLKEHDGALTAIAMEEFWENCPKAIEANNQSIVLRLFPHQFAGPHELQGGEQKTHSFHVAFDRDEVTTEPLAWCRKPLLIHADAEWYATAEAIPYFTPKSTDTNSKYLDLADQAIRGPDTFFHKREVIDEYGWRHFGDVYADHEAVYSQDAEPLTSHYNNQFDVVLGCAAQFLRSPRREWWDLLIPAADHTCDIDHYHTTHDKAAYNHGLFWPTFHYNDADTGTHRTYPSALRSVQTLFPGKSLQSMGSTGAKLNNLYAGGVGGGPSASHNYNQGLMLAYFLTGNPNYRESALNLAYFVVEMDRPRKLLRLLSNEYSGLATASGGDDYHGPGRASGNSISALIVGHRLSGDRSLLEKAEQLIRRASHPHQDLFALDLLNAELRWYYTMHLQALGLYLDHKEQLNDFDEMFEYTRQTLLHYADWMAEHEHPILDKSDELQYPTESWAAQDLRKVEVFQYAAKYALDGESRNRFLERAEWFFQYVETTLSEMPTRSFCRPVVLLMNFGWTRNWWTKMRSTSTPRCKLPSQLSQYSWGQSKRFQPQKIIARQRLLYLIWMLAMFMIVMAVLTMIVVLY